MTEIKKSYYAIIPGNVRYDESLIPNAKLLYGEITALCNEKGYCWAGDKYFCDLYKVNRTTVQRWFKSLESQGYIYREVKFRKGTREIEHRYTYLCDKGIRKNETTPTRKNETDNNTVINNTSNNTLDSNTMSSKLDDTSDSIPYKEIVEYLNDKADRNYKHSTKKTKTLIKARWNEGFRLEEFKTVIEVKVASWSSNTMSNFLRPETLFGTKFESYLNEKGGGPNNESEYDGYF